MSGFNDHATIDGDWKHGSPSPREAFKSILGDGISSRSDINRRSESEKKTVFERVAVREGLNVPALHTGNIVVSHDFSSNNMYTRSPYFTIPTGLCPTTLLESPIFLSSSLDQRSPTTGKFQFAPDGNGTISNLDEENVDSTFFSYKPVIESGHSSFLVASSKITPVPISSNILRSQVEKDLPISETSHFHWGDDVNSQARVVDVVGGSVADSPPSDDGEDLTGVGDATRSADASEDGYNWRKYGQKQVKGSDYPRSYYKCTHASCTVKKKIERSREGHITEIIYKGAHNHPTPHPDRISTHELIDSRNIQNGVAFESSSAFCNYDDDEEESDSNRRKMGEYVSETSEGTRAIKKPKVVVQTTSQVDILDDGYHWRKYGQKVVKGNPNPRSYYKCTSPGCIVRKQVERASHDLNSVITMYEGKHNHDVPAARNSGYSNSGSPVNGTAQVGNNVSLLAHLQRADPSQIHNNTYGFYGMNESGLANLVMARLGTSSEMGFVLPKGEPNSEPLSESSHLNIPNFPNVNSEVMRNYG